MSGQKPTIHDEIHVVPARAEFVELNDGRGGSVIYTHEQIRRTMQAAPEMLEALKYAVDALLCDNDESDRCMDHKDTDDGWEDCNPCTVRKALLAAIAKADGR